MTTTLHAHIDTVASDCDGPLYRDYVVTMDTDEQASEFGDLVFKARVLDSQVYFSGEFGQTVNITEGGFDTYRHTDEGYSASDVRWCEDESCDPESRGQRDVFAEMMGY